jgi:hypothetical protein
MTDLLMNYHNTYLSLFAGLLTTLLQKTDSFAEKYSLHRLKMGSLVEYLGLLNMKDEITKITKVFTGIGVIFIN